MQFEAGQRLFLTGVYEQLSEQGDSHLATAPQLTATSTGDVLELRPSGSWIAANGSDLETFSNAVIPQLEQVKSLNVDMRGLSELD
ncbi:MAG: hypothetical protein J0H25_10065, partial [Rhizobiales bacterium]|nr:hypothetical protein [Hyphomicrobiales bacterium]